MNQTVKTNLIYMVKFLQIIEKKAEMKKLSYLFAAIVMIAALGSCEQDESEILLKKGGAGSETTILPSSSGVAPVIISGSNNGGNVTCAEVAAAFDLPEGSLRCGEKIDFANGMFAGEFPDGLKVDVADGKYVSFSMGAPLMIDGRQYIVGAVIVKGGNKANVYFYPEGTMSDSGLASPANNSGKPAGLSNLTFCLVEQFPELVIGVKTYLAKPLQGEVVTYIRKSAWAVSDGLGVVGNSLFMGYNFYNFNGENEWDLMRATLSGVVGKIGTISADDFWEEGVHYLEVVIDLDTEEFVFDETYLYVGSLKGYQGRYYTSFPFKALDVMTGQRIFKIPFGNITM